jgi:hypothetical protein
MRTRARKRQRKSQKLAFEDTLSMALMTYMGYRSKSLQEEALKNGFDLDIVKRSAKWVTHPKQSKNAREIS